MKKIAVASTAIIFLVSVCSSQALAGSKQQHRWEGVAIGLGAALVGAALLNHHSTGAGYAASAQVSPPQRHPSRVSGANHHRSPQRGHWETRNVWVDPVVERVWNPPHYNRRGHWVAGKWITVERSAGYWKNHRVWVSHR